MRKDPVADVPVRIWASLVDIADRERNDVSRARWINRKLESVLSDTKDPCEGEQAGPGSVPSDPGGVRPAAPTQDHAATMAERQRRLEKARKR